MTKNDYNRLKSFIYKFTHLLHLYRVFLSSVEFFLPIHYFACVFDPKLREILTRMPHTKRENQQFEIDPTILGKEN